MRTVWVTVQDGRTALHWAAEEGHVSVAEYLVDHGADIEVKDRVSRFGRVSLCVCLCVCCIDWASCWRVCICGLCVYDATCM